MFLSTIGSIIFIFLLCIGHYRAAAADQCTIGYMPSFCTYHVSCVPIQQSEALITFVNQTSGFEQMQFLTPTDLVSIQGNNYLYTFNASDMNSAGVVCNNGKWVYVNPNGSYYGFANLLVYRPDPKDPPLTNIVGTPCQFKPTYMSSVCTDLSLSPCEVVFQTAAMKVIVNDTVHKQQIQFLTNNHHVVLLTEEDGMLDLSPSQSLNGKLYCEDGLYAYYTDRILTVNSLAVYGPETNCVSQKSCSSDLKYDTTLCDAVKSSDPSISYCSPILDTSDLFTIKQTLPCTEQSVTFFTRSLKAAIFLTNETMYRTAFATEKLKSKVSCHGGIWYIYDSSTKESLEINKLMIFNDACGKLCSANLNYDATLCAKVKAADPSVTSCKAVENNGQLFNIRDNNGCAQSVTFTTKSLKTAIFLQDGTLYNSVFSSDLLKDRVYCSDGTWIFYERTTEKTFPIDKLMLFS